MIHFAAVANPTAVFNALRVIVSPVHEPAQVVPLVHTAKIDTITQPDGNPSGQVYVVCNKHRLAILQSQYEPLVPSAVIVVRDQPFDEPGALDPGAGVPLAVEIADAISTRRSAVPS